MIFKKKRLHLDSLNSQVTNLSIDRSSVRIAIIDDLDIPYLENLRNCGYTNVYHYRDIDNFEMLSSYSVIVCDIRDVGKKLSNREGAFIIQQLRKIYPDKYIIAMSSNVFALPIQSYISTADAKIKRDSSPDKILEEIEQGVKTMNSKKLRWLRMRDHLLKEHQMDLYDVWLLEQEFIRSVQNNNRKFFENSKITQHSGDMLKGLLVNFISGIIF
ncbi:hypothetical protein ACDI08_10610 [Vibrio alginolyticus]|uniref:hypothetical protein n=1 Tax=Vibrio alginolyticus TaxID=663 RepID=UPI003556CD3C